MSEPPSYPPAAQPPAQPSGLPSALANLTPSTLLWAQVGGAAVVLISIFLPWVTVSAGMFGSTSGNGFDAGAYGALLLILSLAAGALAFIEVRGIRIQGLNLPGFVPLALASAMLVIAFIAWLDVLNSTGGSEFEGLEVLGADFGVSSGIGIWLVLLAALVTFAAALLPVLKARKAG